MSRNAQRQSQVVTTFGPGSMVDLPTRSVVIGGLELWDVGGNASQTIAEPRLAQRLERLLQEQGRLAEGQRLTLRTPPVQAGRNEAVRGVEARVFPTWFVCEQVEASASPTGQRRRRLVRWDDLDGQGRRRYRGEDGKAVDVTPIRFVCACENGHLQDIDWRRLVNHATPDCREPMWIEESGTSADPADTSIVCGCGGRVSLQDTFQPGRLGKCRGERPWLERNDPAGCDQNLKLLTRTATNTYFPQVLTVISLPAEEDDLSRLVAEVAGDMANIQTLDDVAMAKRFNPKLSATLGPYPDAAIFDRLQRVREGGSGGEAGRSPRLAEFEMFGSGRAEIGTNHPSAKLYAQTLPREAWATGGEGLDLTSVTSLVAVHRLREVSCLYGFTRFEAAPTAADGDIEDVRLAVRGAPISDGADWLPAVEQFGEGLFIQFDEGAVTGWLDRPAVQARTKTLLEAYGQWSRRFGASAPSHPGIAYVLLHSISHALITEIALDCGYPASSLKERIYALSGRRGGPVDRLGILIYTASAGAQGTLGGLVGTAPRFAHILASALDRARICSNDPICADHEPDDHSGDRATHGAACHGCLLIAETSCEARNLHLDRSLVVPTMAGDGAAFF